MLRIASGSGSGDVLNDRGCTDSIKGESFREQKSVPETPPVSFSGSEKSVKRLIAGSFAAQPASVEGGRRVVKERPRS